MSAAAAAVVKVQLNDELRRFNLPEGARVAALLAHVAQLFPQLAQQPFKLYYTDDENDRVRIANDDDLAEAVHYGVSTQRPLRLAVELDPAAAAASSSSTARPAPAQQEAADTFTYDERGRVLHLQVQCDLCGVSPIAGPCFKCADCPDFDMCEACEAKGAHPASHVLLKMRLPSHVRVINAGTPRRAPVAAAAVAAPAVAAPSPSSAPAVAASPSVPPVVVQPASPQQPQPQPSAQLSPQQQEYQQQVLQQQQYQQQQQQQQQYQQYQQHYLQQQQPASPQHHGVYPPVPVMPAPIDSLRAKYTDQLRQVRDMGLRADDADVCNLLEAYRGNLVVVVNVLVERQRAARPTQ